MNSLIWIIFASVLLSPVTCKPLAENKLHKEAATKKERSTADTASSEQERNAAYDIPPPQPGEQKRNVDYQHPPEPGEQKRTVDYQRPPKTGKQKRNPLETGEQKRNPPVTGEVIRKPHETGVQQRNAAN